MPAYQTLYAWRRTAQESDLVAWINVNDVVHPVGSVVCTSSSTSPASSLGGTWSLIDKELTPAAGTATVAQNTTNTSSFICEFTRGGGII